MKTPGRAAFALICVPVALSSSISAAVAQGGDPIKRSAETTKATSKGSTFVATATAMVDPDGTVHQVHTPASTTTSPYEYQVHRVQSICPNDALGQPRDLVFVDYRLISAGPNGYWTNADVICAAPASQPLDFGNIAAQVATVTQTLTPPPPTISVRPDGTTLVGNPTIFSGSDPGDQTPPALVNPLSGRTLQLTVHPTTWTWDFDDGSPSVTTQGPSPAYNGSLDGLLTHTYRRAGDVTVRVTVTWTASYTISGVAGTQNVGSTVASTTTVPLRVRAARTQLVSH